MAEEKNTSPGIVLFSRRELPGEAAVIDQLASRLGYAGIKIEEQVVRISTSAGSMESDISGALKRRGFSRAVLAGVLPGGRFQTAEFRSRQAVSAGLGESSLSVVPFPRKPDSSEEVLAGLTEEILRAVTVLSMLPGFDFTEVPVNREILVLGGGFSGIQTALALSSRGFQVTLVEKTDQLGGGNALFQAGISMPADDVFTEISEKLHVYRQCVMTGLEGQLGGFRAELSVYDGKDRQSRRVFVDCGALVLAVGNKPAEKETFPVDSPLLVRKEELKALVPKLKRKSKSLSIGIILDYAFPETKASTESALQTALALQKQYERQVSLFLRDARVSALHIEKLYAAARDAGVAVVKYEGKPEIAETDEGLAIRCRDSILGAVISLTCDVAGISTQGLETGTDRDLLRITGVTADSLGQAQENNIHLLPVETNIPGIAAVGACRGTHYLPQITDETAAAVLYLEGLLGGPVIRIESSQARVDPEKCVLCLTCVRSCPFRAMRVNREKGVAESLAHVCKRCGICAGECPAKAIELPVYPDKALLFQAV